MADLAWVAVLFPLAALVFALTVLAIKAWPAIRRERLVLPHGTLDRRRRLLRDTVPPRRAPPAGRVVRRLGDHLGDAESSVIAIVIAVPISVGAAFALTERMPSWISRPRASLEILAGIPSVVFGLWGVLTFGPWLATTSTRPSPTPAQRPGALLFRAPTATGEGLLTAGSCSAVMIVPIIAATTRDLFAQVPRSPRRAPRRSG